MATMIIVINITAGPAVDVYLPDLGVNVPASGSVTLTDSPYEFGLSRIQEDEELKNAIAAGSLKLNDGTRDLTEAESAELLQPGVGGGGIARRPAVINLVDCTAAPPTEVTGDRYILDFTVGSVHADWDGASKGDIVQFDGSVWGATTPAEGWVAYVDAQGYDIEFTNDGTPAWTMRNHAGRTDNPHAVTAVQAGADPAGAAGTAVSNHESTYDHAHFQDAAKRLFSIGTNEAIFLSLAPPQGRNRFGHAVIDFDDTLAESVEFFMQMPINYDGGDFRVVLPTAARSLQALPKNIGWQIEIERMQENALGLNTASFAAAQQVVAVCPASDQVVYASITFTQAQADGIQASELFRMRLTRYNIGVVNNVIGDAELVDGIFGELV